jgi:hypothetical protein
MGREIHFIYKEEEYYIGRGTGLSLKNRLLQKWQPFVIELTKQDSLRRNTKVMVRFLKT